MTHELMTHIYIWLIYDYDSHKTMTHIYDYDSHMTYPSDHYDTNMSNFVTTNLKAISKQFETNLSIFLSQNLT